MPRSTIPMTLTPDSHQIHGYGYDAATQTMVLTFKSSADTKDYEYPNTPPEKFAELAAAESKGSWWYKNKPQFPTYVIKTEDAPADSEGGEAA